MEPPHAQPPAAWVDLAPWMRSSLRRATWFAVVVGMFAVVEIVLPVVAILVWGWPDFSTPHEGRWLVGAVAIFLIGLLMALMSGRAFWALPRCFARQGILVDEAGLTLHQDAHSWCDARICHVPWEQVRFLDRPTPGSRSGADGVLHLFTAEKKATRPSWARLVAAHARPDRWEQSSGYPRIFLLTGPEAQEKLRRAIRAVNPGAMRDG
jgi:hypothetical protein